jgi:hypothetical protein
MALPQLARGPSGRGSGRTHDIGPSSCARQITSFPTNLLTLSTEQTATRKIIVNNVGAGSKALQWTGSDGFQQTWDVTNLQGVALEIEAISLDSGCTVASVLVFF